MHISVDEEFLKVREREREGGRGRERMCVFSARSAFVCVLLLAEIRGIPVQCCFIMISAEPQNRFWCFF